MAYEAAADVTVAEVEAPAQTEAPVEAAAAEADVSATIAAPAGDVAAEAATEPEPDRTFELMVDVMGDDLNDEKVGRLAEKLDAGKRKLFLAAVAAKRAIIESATVVEASAASAVEGSAEAANTGTEVSTDGGVGSANGSS
jgi:hypothetical protein